MWRGAHPCLLLRAAAGWHPYWLMVLLLQMQRQLDFKRRHTLLQG
jgi:hypothetical protein